MTTLALPTDFTGPPGVTVASCAVDDCPCTLDLTPLAVPEQTAARAETASDQRQYPHNMTNRYMVEFWTDASSGRWFAQQDDLHLVADAKTIDELQDRMNTAIGRARHERGSFTTHWTMGNR
jgi:hypothetical protein